MSDLALEPLAVWDVGEAQWWHNWEVKSQWLREHGLPVNEMYRIEFLPGEPPQARIFCYVLNEDGRKHWNENHAAYLADRSDHDHSLCDVTREPPRIVPLSELPPLDLRSG